MNTNKPTPFEARGWLPSDTFRVLVEVNFTKGSVVKLMRDDGSAYPRFTLISGGLLSESSDGGAYCGLAHLEKIDTEPAKPIEPIVDTSAAADYRYLVVTDTCSIRKGSILLQKETEVASDSEWGHFGMLSGASVAGHIWPNIPVEDITFVVPLTAVQPLGGDSSAVAKQLGYSWGDICELLEDYEDLTAGQLAVILPEPGRSQLQCALINTIHEPLPETGWRVLPWHLLKPLERVADTLTEAVNSIRPAVNPRTASVLTEANSIIYGDREQTYGRPGKNLHHIAGQWNMYLQQKYGFPLITLSAEDVCWMMADLKKCRQMNTAKRDNLVDAIGYIALIERLEE